MSHARQLLRAWTVSTIAAIMCMAFVAAGACPRAVAAGGPRDLGQSGAIAQDTALHLVYIAQPFTNKVFVLDSHGMSLVDVLLVPPTPSAIAVDQTRHVVYIASDTMGVLTKFSELTFERLNTFQLGGHPGGLSVVEGGRSLIISDEVSGTVDELAVSPATSQPVQVLDMGPGPSSAVALGPRSSPSGSKVLVWGRGFNPGEQVDVCWGLQPLVRIQADVMGAVVGRFTVPRHVALGLHLVVLEGTASNSAESTLLNVVPPPPPPPKPAPKPVATPKPSLIARVQQVLDSDLVLAPPQAIAVGPLNGLRLDVPTTYLVIAYVVITVLVLMLRFARRRARAKPERRAPRRRPAAPAKAAS